MLFIGGHPPAPLAHVFSVFHQLLVFLEFVFYHADVVQEAQMSFVSRMGHLNVSHEYPLLSFLEMIQESTLFISINFNLPFQSGKWVKYCIF